MVGTSIRAILDGKADMVNRLAVLHNTKNRIQKFMATQTMSHPPTGVRNGTAWKFHGGSHFYCKTNRTGFIEKVLGTVVMVEGEKYVGCLDGKWDTYTEFDELDQAKVHVEAIAALTEEA